MNLHGTKEIFLDLSGLTVRLGGLEPAVAGMFEERWPRYLTGRTTGAVLDGEIRVGGIPYGGKKITTKTMRSRFEADHCRFDMEEGRVRLSADGSARFDLAPAADTTRFYALVNLMLASIAWFAPRHDCLLLHAAGAIFDRRAFLLIGSENAGKTTWAGLSRQAGAAVLSDDVVLVSVRDDGSEAMGTPFREPADGPCGPGRWPIAAMLLPVHGETPALRAVPALLAQARIAANIPFINERIGVDPAVDAAIERLASAVPFRSLTFARDTGFVPLLRTFDSSGA